MSTLAYAETALLAPHRRLTQPLRSGWGSDGRRFIGMPKRLTSPATSEGAMTHSQRRERLLLPLRGEAPRCAGARRSRRCTVAASVFGVAVVADELDRSHQLAGGSVAAIRASSGPPRGDPSLLSAHHSRLDDGLRWRQASGGAPGGEARLVLAGGYRGCGPAAGAPRARSCRYVAWLGSSRT